MIKIYVQQLELLLQCLPSLASETCFAIKGGTAINLFLQDLPRLSVDIDLVYLPISGRQESLNGIEIGLLNIKNRLEKRSPELIIHAHKNRSTESVTKLYVQNQTIQIVIEPNLILRGLVYPCQKMNLMPSVVTRFQVFVSDVNVASFHDIYAGKICAALDRQHPRDLFDIRILLKKGLSLETKKAFLIYLACSNRPMHELLNPNPLDLKKIYNEEFLGMANISVNYEALIEARENLIKVIHQSLNDEDKAFLISIKRGEPNWDKIDLPQVQQLPGLKWKLLNIGKMDKDKHTLALKNLEKALYRC